MIKIGTNKTLIIILCGIAAVAIFAIVFKDVTLYNKTNPTIKKWRVETLHQQKLNNSASFLYPEKFVISTKDQQI